MADIRLGVVAAVSVCALAATGCGSSSKSSSSQSSSSSSAATAAQYEAKLKGLLSGSGQGTSSVPGVSTPSTPGISTPGASPGASTGVPISAVTCPAGVKPTNGTPFQCQVTGPNGVHGSVSVTPTDSTGKKFNFKANLTGNGYSQQSSGNATLG